MLEINTVLDLQPAPGCGCSACINNDSSPYYDDEEDSSVVGASSSANYYSYYGAEDTPSYLPGQTSTGTTDRALQLYTNREWGNGGGEGVTITYSFLSSVPNYYSGGDQEQSQFHAFTNTMQVATRQILDMISNYADITFSEVAGVGDMTFGQAWLTSSQSDPGAWAYYPDGGSKSGDVWTNYKFASSFANPVEGGYGWFALAHEIGHALGLQHTFSAFNLDPSNSTVDNTEKYSVMAYNWDIWGYTYAETLQLYDIYALQTIYGANTTHNLGNTVHTLEYGSAYTIYDAGGIDTLSAAGENSAVTINLYYVLLPIVFKQDY